MKSINVKRAVIKETDGKLTIQNEEESLDLLEEIKKFKDVEFVNLKLGKARNGSGERKPKYVYTCKCGNTIKSKEPDMEIECLKCHSKFEISEE